MSKRSCIVPNCLPEDRKANSVTYFKFPSDPTRCKEWITNCSRQDLMNRSPKELNSGQYFICSNHFTGENISKTKPKRIFRNSVPTVFPKLSEESSSIETATKRDNSDENISLVPPFKKIKLGKPYSVPEEPVLTVNKTPNQKSYQTKSPTTSNSQLKNVVFPSPPKHNSAPPAKHTPTILSKKQPKEILKQIKGPSNTTIQVVQIPDQTSPMSKALPINPTPVQTLTVGNLQNSLIQLVDINGKAHPTLIQISGNHDGKITPELISQITQALNSGALQTGKKTGTPVKRVDPLTLPAATTPKLKKIVPKPIASTGLPSNSGLSQTTQKIVTPVKPAGVTPVKPVGASTSGLVTPIRNTVVPNKPVASTNLTSGLLQPTQKLITQATPANPLSNLILVVTPPSKKIVTKEPVANIDLTETDDEEPVKKCKVSQCRKTRPKCHFPVPQEEFVLELWRTSLSNSKLTQGDWVCDEHFLDTDIYEMGSKKEYILKKHALPAISKRDIRPTCIVPFCKNQRYIAYGENLYPIPFWENLFFNWSKVVYNLKDTDKNSLMKYRICSRHFSNLHSVNLFELMPDRFLPPDMYAEVLREWKKKEPINEEINENICAFWRCKAEASDELMQFTKFPVDFELCQAWLTICNRGDILLKPVYEIEKFVRKSHGVCFVHREDIKRNMDKFDDLFKDLPHDTKLNGSKPIAAALGYKKPATAKKTQRTAPQPSEPVLIYVPSKEYCAYVNCSTYIRTQFVRKYKFPINKDLLKQWSEAAGIDPKIPIKYDYLFICGKHFRLDQYTERGTLRKNSVPINHIEYIDSKANTSNPQWLKKQWQTKKKQVVAPQPPRVNVASTPNTSSRPLPLATYGNKSLAAGGSKSCSDCDGIGIVFGQDRLAANKKSTIYCTRCKGSGEIGNATPLITLTGPGSIDRPNQNIVPRRLPTHDEVLELYGEKCCVKHCASLATTHALYPFPPISENRKYLLWIKAVTNSPNVKIDWKSPNHVVSFKKKQICAKHFEEKYFEDNDIGKRKLKDNAVPTLDLIKVDKDVEVVEDTEIKWESCDFDEADDAKPFIKGRAMLKESSIEFHTIKKSLTFGTGCPKKGLNRFPYNIYSLPRTDRLLSKEYVPAYHPFQFHTAVVIDDDSDAEAEAVDMIYEAMKENDFPKYNAIKTELKIR